MFFTVYKFIDIFLLFFNRDFALLWYISNVLPTRRAFKTLTLCMHFKFSTTGFCLAFNLPTPGSRIWVRCLMWNYNICWPIKIYDFLYISTIFLVFYIYYHVMIYVWYREIDWITTLFKNPYIFISTPSTGYPYFKGYPILRIPGF